MTVVVERGLRWVRYGVAGAGVVLALTLVMPVLAQPTDVERRVTSLENLRPDARLSQIETRLDTIERVMWGILVAVATQIVVGGLTFKRGQRG